MTARLSDGGDIKAIINEDNRLLSFLLILCQGLANVKKKPDKKKRSSNQRIDKSQISLKYN